VTAAKTWKPIAVAAAAAIIMGVLGAVVTDLSPWYYALKKPSFQPPDWLFGPVWTAIFAMLATSGVLAWRTAADAGTRSWVIRLYAFNLVLNLLWSTLFFRFQRPDWALFEVVFLWASIAALIWSLLLRSRLASWLLVPYLVWVTFAAILNMAIVQLNGPFGAR
jgi:translocator protein